MVNSSLVRSIFAAAVILGSGVAARADFVIDTFAEPNPTPNPTYELGSSVGSTYTATHILSGGIIRETRVELLANDFGDSKPASGVLGTPPSGPARFSLSTVAGATAYASLKYTYQGDGVDLSGAGTALQFNFLFADLNTPFSVSISDADGVTSAQSGTVTASGSGVYKLPVADFAGIDLTKVKSITLTLNRDSTRPDQPSTTSADFTLAAATISTPPETVPAPPAAALSLMAVPALGLWWAARRRAAA